MNLKLFGKNTVIYGIGNIGLRAASFLLIPLYTHTLTVSDYGLLATLLMTIQIMIIIMGLGSRTGLVRFTTEYENKDRLGHLLSSSVLINIIGGLFLTGISILFLRPLFENILHTDQVFEYVLFTCGAALSQCLCIHVLSYYRAKNEAFKYMLASMSAMMLLIIINLVFLLVLHFGIKGVLISQIITYSIIWLVVSYNIASKIGIGFSMDVIFKLLRFGLPLVFAMSGDLVTDVSAIYFLSYFQSLEEVAIYSLGYKLAQIAIIVFISPFQLSYEPFVFANIEKPGIRITIARLFTYFMIGFVFVAFGIIFFSKKVLSIIAPPEYNSAFLILFLILPGLAFRGVYYIGQSLLYIKKKTSIAGVVVSIFTLLSLVLNYFLIPLYGKYGIILVFNFTLISTALVVTILGMNAFHIPLQGKRLVISGLMLVTLVMSVFFLRNTTAYIYYTIAPLMAFICLASLYFGSFFDDREKSIISGLFNKAKIRFCTLL